MEQKIIDLLIILRQKADNAQSLIYQPASNDERASQWQRFEKLLGYLFTLQKLFSNESDAYYKIWHANENPQTPVMTLVDQMLLINKINQKLQNDNYRLNENEQSKAQALVNELPQILDIYFPSMTAPAAGGSLHRKRKTHKYKKNKKHFRSKNRNNK